jgi:glycosyltransferase involved in cell wall biosynthesis
LHGAERTLRPVVFVTGKDPATPGGLHVYVRAHARAAAAAGFDPHVFCLAPRAGLARTDFGLVHRVATPVRPIMGLMATAHRPLLARAVVRSLSEWPRGAPYLVHSFGPWALVGAAASRALARRGVAAIPVASAYTTMEHEHRAMCVGLARHHGVLNALRYSTRYLWTRAVADGGERRGYESSRVVYVNYAATQELLRASYGDGFQIRRLPYASEAAFTQSEGGPEPRVPDHLARLQPGDGPLVVAVSRHDPRKGLDVLLRALAEIVRGGIPFRACLVGPGPLLAAHRRLARDLGLEDRVAIPGQVEDVFAYLRSADVFVLPSLEEGSGSVSLLEALQARIATVASDCDGIPEDLVDGEDGLLVPPGDERALRDALAKLLRDPSLRSRLAARAGDVYRERFSASAFIEGLASAYADVGIVP